MENSLSLQQHEGIQENIENNYTDYFITLFIKTMSDEKNRYHHNLYQYKENIKDSDAIAWVFTSQDKMEKIPFCFLELQNQEPLYLYNCSLDNVQAKLQEDAIKQIH